VVVNAGYCDGKAGSIDRHHHLVFFSFDPELESIHCLLSPTPKRALLKVRPRPSCKVVYLSSPGTAANSNATVGYIEEAVYQLHMDVNTLLSFFQYWKARACSRTYRPSLGGVHQNRGL
jgi:hypothetical protein